MCKLNKYYLLIIFLILSFFYGCTKIRESAGASRTTPDEFQTFEYPPLIIPPDYSLVPPDQLKEKNIENTEKELAEAILFGLEKNNVNTKNQLSTMNHILSEANADNVSDNIRNEINEDFADEQHILDAVKESQTIRENKFNNELIIENEIPIKKQKVKKKKKKKKFFIF